MSDGVDHLASNRWMAEFSRCPRIAPPGPGLRRGATGVTATGAIPRLADPNEGLVARHAGFWPGHEVAPAPSSLLIMCLIRQRDGFLHVEVLPDTLTRQQIALDGIRYALAGNAGEPSDFNRT